jgi:hypothetical protein
MVVAQTDPDPGPYRRQQGAVGPLKVGFGHRQFDFVSAGRKLSSHDLADGAPKASEEKQRFDPLSMPGGAAST